MTDTERELEAAETAFNQAMVSNDADRIRGCITEDWCLVTPERGPVSGADVLAAIASGILGHDTMTKRTHLMRAWGDVAVVVGRGQNTGWFRGAPISADEWVCDIYRRVGGDWKCELTQLTPVIMAKQPSADGN
ncbi:MAG: nuclear transport factor 2 family protein [Rhodobacter sp.]|nr:nuclear transport factor 2 family protein [Paracoccaceae bacterium]MCC0077240.1 nuclear transport factor 2 family protein [Rhodobacter sp.]